MSNGAVAAVRAVLTASILFALALVIARACIGTVNTPWPPVWALATTLAIVLHKRLVAPGPFGPDRKFSAFFYAALLHFLPAVVCWTAAVFWARANVFPWLAGIPGQFVVLVGVLFLAKLLVEKELRKLGAPKPV